MSTVRRSIVLGGLIAAMAAGAAIAWPWRSSTERFCDTLREEHPDPERGVAAAVEQFLVIAPGEIRADALFVRDFTRRILTGRFPGASGPGTAILAMNPDFVAAQERIAAYVQRTCGLSPPGAADTAEIVER